MIIQANWKEIVDKINGTTTSVGWNKGDGLGMIYDGPVLGPQSWGGAAAWTAGNCTIIVNSSGENSSIITLETQTETANNVALNTWEKLIKLIKTRSGWKIDSTKTQKKIGNSGLTEEDLIYRLAKAWEGEELKKNDAELTWKEVIDQVGWNRGTTNASKLKLFEDARNRLKRVVKSGDKKLLEKVEMYRAKEKKNK